MNQHRELPMPRTRQVIADGIANALHLGAQVYVSQGGRTIADIAMGESRAGVQMTPQTLLLWMSTGKMISAVAIAQLWERGLLQMDDRVAIHIPEFAAGGKADITIRHLLTHTAGFRGTRTFQDDQPWQAIVSEVCNMHIEPGWVPGQKAGYHHAASWVILGELIRRLGGRPPEQYFRDEIFLPLEMDNCWNGMPPERYREYGDRIGFMHQMSSTDGSPPPGATYFGDTEAGMSVCRPGGNTHGPVRELGRFLEMMLGHGQRNGRRLLQPQTVDAMTARHRVRLFDHTFKSEIDWGLGFILHTDLGDSDAFPYSFKPNVSPRTFGHGGYQSSAAFADPERQLVVAFVFNGTPGEEAHRARRRAMQNAVQEDLANP